MIKITVTILQEHQCSPFDSVHS